MTEAEIKELEELKKDPLTKVGSKIRDGMYKDKQKLYKLRYFKKLALKNMEDKQICLNLQ